MKRKCVEPILSVLVVGIRCIKKKKSDPRWLTVKNASIFLEQASKEG